MILSLSVSAQDNTQDSALIADPGHARSIEVGTAARLDGSRSISTSRLRLTYAWSLIEQPEGSLTALEEADSPRPSLVPDFPGDYIAQLIVTDSEGSSSAAQTVLLTTNNVPPVAVAGADRITAVGQSLRLDPEGTYDADGDRLEAAWSILSFPSPLSDDDTTEPLNSGAANLFCPAETIETVGDYHVVSATSNQQNPHLAVGAPLAEGTTETGNNSATTYYGPITMDLTGDASLFVPAGEVIEVVLSSAWGTSARAEILMSLDGVIYTSLGTTGNGGSVYGAYSSNILRYDDFVVPAGGARFLQVSQQNSGVRADGVIYNTQCKSDGSGVAPEEEEDQSSLAGLVQDEDGRYVFTPNVSGEYSIQLLVEDDEGARSVDVVNIYAAPSDGTGDPADANIAPVANAGLSQLTTVGQAIILDGSQSTDVNGDMLSYQWSILSKPADSFSVIENGSSAIASLTPDTERTYILQLEVTDMNGLKDYDTVLLSGSQVSPVAVSGGPIAGADGAISSQSASVDGASSQSADGVGVNLAYNWSVLGLGDGESEIENATSLATDIDFSGGSDESSSGSETQIALELLGEYNLIAFNNVDSSVDIKGRTLIGGNLIGNSATFGSQLQQGQDIIALSVAGNISGGAKNINNGGDVRLGGSVSSHLNLNGGGQLINDPSLGVTSEQSALLALSTQIAALEANSTAQIPSPNGQHGPGRLNASPNSEGIAVFDIADGNTLFRNDRVQQIEVNANGADTIIVNVGGADIDFNRGNFVGAVQGDDLRRKIIWNFHEATDLYFERAFHGTLLAPRAHLFNRSDIRGAVIVDSLQARGPLALPGFNGTGLTFEAQTVETDFALVQLAVSDTNNPNLEPSYSSTVLTTGNLRPVARVTQSGGPGILTPGVEVGFDATSSFDGDNDTLSYSWSILSKPEGSSIELINSSSTNVSITPENSGVYIVQLIVSDGQLFSRPVTFTIEAQNAAPIAEAGENQTVFQNELVTLDGSGSSDPDGDDLTYLWAFAEKPDGSQAALSDETNAAPTFVADVKGSYVLSLTVNDGIQDSSSDSVTVLIENRAPNAVVDGETTATAGETISVSGQNSSDADGDTLSYNWVLDTPEGSSTVLLSPNSVAPSFVPDIEGTYTVTLTVSDGFVSSTPVEFLIEVDRPNTPPVLDSVSDQVVAVGANLSFQLSASDIDGDALSYSVAPFPLPAGASLDAQTGIFQYTALSRNPAQLNLTFSVSDGISQASQSATIDVISSLEQITSFSGKVVDGVTGEPIPDATITVSEIGSVQSDLDGKFEIIGLPVGTIEVWVTATSDQQDYAPVVFSTTILEFAANVATSNISLMPAVAAVPFSFDNELVLESVDNSGIAIKIPAGEAVVGNVSRYWRIFVNEIPLPRERTSFGEWELREVSGGENILTGGLVTSSSEFRSDFTASNLFDGLPGTAWAAGPRGGAEDWVAYDLGEGQQRPIAEVVIQARSSSTFAPLQSPINFSIQNSNDGVTWNTVSDFETSADWVANETRNFIIPFSEPSTVTLSALSPEDAVSLPPNVSPCQLFIIGPKGLHFNTVEISVDNYDLLEAGSVVDVWSFENGRFRIIGEGVVNSTGQKVVAEVENLRSGSPIALAPRVHNLELTQDQASEYFASSVLGDGAYKTVHSLPSFGLLGERETTSLIYNSRSADATSLISAQAQFADNVQPSTLQTSVLLSGSQTNFNDVINVDDQTTITQTAIIDGRGLGAGVYPYQFLSIAQYGCSRVTATLNANISISDESESPYGAGWMVDGIQRLRVNESGVSIQQPDGSILQFEPPMQTFSEDFTDGFGGWGTINPSVGITFEPTGGNPGGYIEETDILAAELVYWTTPPGLVERLSDFIGGEFSYDLIQNNLTNPLLNITDDVVIETVSGTRTLFFDYPDTLMPGTAWTRFRVLFSHDAGWAIRRSDGRVDTDVTEEEFAEIISEASVFRFRAEHRNGNDVVGLDNAAFGPETVDFTDGNRISATFESVNGDFSALIANTNGGFERRYPNGTQVVFDEQGLQIAEIDRNGNETRYAYDENDRVIEIIDPEGLTTNFSYIGRNLSTITDPTGRESIFGYDETGVLVRIENPEGEVSRFDYNQNNRLISQIDRRGLTTTHNYGPAGAYSGSELPDGTNISVGIARSLGLDDLGTLDNPRDPIGAADRITEFVDGRGNESSVEVNSFGSPIKQTDELGRVTLFERDENNLVTAIIEPSSVTTSSTIRTELEYDERGNVILQREAVGTALERELIFEYEPEFSRLIRSVDADGFETTMNYDANGNMIRMTDPLGGVELMSYNSQGLVTSSTDKNGNVTTYEYDNFGRLERTTDPNDISTRLVLSAEGNVLVQIDGEGTADERRITTGYDSLNRKIIETAGDGGNTNYEYNENDYVISVTDPTGITETRSYDDRDRLEIINDPATGATIMAYDEDSNITRMTDALGETTEFAYDAVDRLLSSVDARGQLRAFAYDLRDNITAITDARANISHTVYDELDRPRSRSNPNDETWSFAYDLRDNRVSAVKPDGAVITSIYDGLSRMTSLSGGDVSRDYSYDAQSNLLAANANLNDISGPELDFTYDGENRFETASVTNLFGSGMLNNTFTYDYDALDRRVSMSDSFSGVSSYAYDPVDRLTRVTTPTRSSFSTNYDLAGRQLGRVAPNATEMIRQYETATGRLSSQVQSVRGRSFNGFEYNYTERGNIAEITETGDVTRDRTYTYDELERLTEVAVPTAPTQEESYEFDPEGNRFSSHLSDTHQTDAANRLTSDASYTYVYDLNGNLIQKLAKAGIGLSDWHYRYDTLDQLIEVSQNNLVVESYRYDAFGRRSLINTMEGAGLTVETAILNDGSDRAIDIKQGVPGQAVPVRRYTHSMNVDEPLQVETFTAAGSFDAAYSYHADHLGSVRYLTDSSGTIVNAYNYDSYGRPMFGVVTFDQPFAYTGREWDQATGLYHYRARAYDAETGRFLQEDPIGFAAGDLNVYRYVLSNPLSYTDPSGLSAAGEKAGTSGIVLGSVNSLTHIGLRLNCIFTAIAAGIELAGQPDLETLDIVTAGTDVALGCGARAKFKKKVKNKKDTCGAKKCFAAGTLVHTREGLKPIEQVKVGDEVKSMNAQTGEIAYKKVTNKHTNHFDPTGLVSFINENNGNVTHLSVTKTHPFYHVAKGWVHASLLAVGDKVTEDDGGTLTVIDVTFNPDAPINLTYNLEVADFHTYFVGEDGVLTHNGRVGSALAQIVAGLGLSNAMAGDSATDLRCGAKEAVEWVIDVSLLDGKSPPGSNLNKYGQWIVKVSKVKFR